MKGFFYNGFFYKEDEIVRIKNPIRAHLTIMNTPEEIQKQQRVDLQVVYENPVGSGEVGTFNTRLTYRDIGLFSEGQRILEDRTGLPSDIKPRPLNDEDFITMKPGERRIDVWHINLGGRDKHGKARDEGRYGSYQYDALEGTHLYEVFVAGNHTLESIVDKTFYGTKENKWALSVDTKSNTVTFTYTKPSKDGKDTSNPPSPPVATPDKLNDASNPDNLAPPRLPLGTQVSSLRSCPESGIYECPADSLGVTEHPLFIHKGRPMPIAFITQTKPGISGVFGKHEEQEVEVTWTLVGYEMDAI